MTRRRRQRRARQAAPAPVPAPEPARRRSRSRGALLAAAVIAAAAIAAYQNAFGGPFVLDDLAAIHRNPTIRTLWPPGRVLAPPERTAVAGRPVVNLSLALNHAIGGFEVRSYHAFNLAVHVLVALVLFAAVRRAFGSPALRERYGERATGLATAAALLWAVHPLASETVVYTIQRTELLMALFFLLTLLFSMRAFESVRPRAWYAAALASFALGMGSKEVTIVAPFVVLAADALLYSRSVRDAIRRHALLYGGFALLVLVLVAFVATRFHRLVTRFGSSRVSPWEYLLTQSGVIVRYLRLALWPDPLVADYTGWPIARSVGAVLPSLLAVGALFALTVWGLLRRRPLAFLGVFFFAILAPTSSIRPMPTEVAAERRMYLPLAAVVILGVIGGEALARRLRAPRAVAAAAVAALAVALAVSTVRRNEDYQTTLSFWSDIVEKRPDNPRARAWLGNHLYENGRPTEGVEHLTEAVRLNPESASNHYSLGIALVGIGKTAEGIEQYREALRIAPNHASAHSNLGLALAGSGRKDEAIAHYREAIRLNPRHAYAHYNLGITLAERGNREEAIEHFEAAIAIEPRIPGAAALVEKLREGGASSP